MKVNDMINEREDEIQKSIADGEYWQNLAKDMGFILSGFNHRERAAFFVQKEVIIRVLKLLRTM